MSRNTHIAGIPILLFVNLRFDSKNPRVESRPRNLGTGAWFLVVPSRIESGESRPPTRPICCRANPVIMSLSTPRRIWWISLSWWEIFESRESVRFSSHIVYRQYAWMTLRDWRVVSVFTFCGAGVWCGCVGNPQKKPSAKALCCMCILILLTIPVIGQFSIVFPIVTPLILSSYSRSSPFFICDVVHQSHPLWRLGRPLEIRRHPWSEFKQHRWVRSPSAWRWSV